MACAGWVRGFARRIRRVETTRESPANAGQSRPGAICPVCDYDLVGVASKVCPECGLELTADNLGDAERMTRFSNSGPGVFIAATTAPFLFAFVAGLAWSPLADLILIAVALTYAAGALGLLGVRRGWRVRIYLLWLRLAWSLHMPWLTTVAALMVGVTVQDFTGHTSLAPIVLFGAWMSILVGWAAWLGATWRRRWMRGALAAGFPAPMRRATMQAPAIVLVILFTLPSLALTLSGAFFAGGDGP